jgi:hypothetical protein
MEVMDFVEAEGPRLVGMRTDGDGARQAKPDPEQKDRDAAAERKAHQPFTLRLLRSLESEDRLAAASSGRRITNSISSNPPT